MLRSGIQKRGKAFFMITLFSLGILHFAFKPAMNEQEMLTWSNRCLSESYDPSGEVKLKKWELSLTGDAFVRLRKDYSNGKEEFYSFHLHRFHDMALSGVLHWAAHYN